MNLRPDSHRAAGKAGLLFGGLDAFEMGETASFATRSTIIVAGRIPKIVQLLNLSVLHVHREDMTVIERQTATGLFDLVGGGCPKATVGNRAKALVVVSINCR